MSKPNDPMELFPRSDPSGDFGREEGLQAYAIISGEHPDWLVEKIAGMAVRLEMIIGSRFDVHDTLAIQSLIKELDGAVTVE